MEIEKTIRVPILDFSGEELKPGTQEWELLRAQVRDAFEQHGCFEAIYASKLTPTLRQELFTAMRQLFLLPTETKMKNLSATNERGYIGNHPMLPLYESFGIDNAHNLEALRPVVDLMWPEGNQQFCEIVNSSSKQLVMLENTIRRMCFESVGMEKYIDSHTDTLKFTLRLQKYKPPPESTEAGVGLVPHNDMNVITILGNDHVGGLEGLSKDGQWLPLIPTPNAVLVMVADSLTAWSNNKFKSLRHRVIMRGKEERFTFGLFSIPMGETIVKAPEELIDKENPPVFKPFVYKDFMRFSYTPEGAFSQEPLKLFAGM